MRFIQKLNERPDSHQLLWVYLLAELLNGQNRFVKKELMETFKISRSTLRRAIDWGVEELNLLGFPLSCEIDATTIRLEQGKAKAKETSAELVAAEKPKKKRKSVDAHTLSMMGDVSEVVDYLNEKSGKRFRPESKNAIKHITARLKEGYSVDDFKYVIDIKIEKWLGTSMEDYLRPETLFGNKFESYLNEKINLNEQQQRFVNTQSAVDQAKNFDFFGTTKSQ